MNKEDFYMSNRQLTLTSYFILWHKSKLNEKMIVNGERITCYIFSSKILKFYIHIEENIIKLEFMCKQITKKFKSWFYF